MKVNDIKKVLILGGGTMGQQIGMQCALCGYDVAIYDISQEILANTMKRIQRMVSKVPGQNFIPGENAELVYSRISATTKPEEAAKDADIISESVPENPKLKAEIFATFNKLCPERTIFTTNTSSLVPSMFAGATGRPDKVISLHFHDTRYSKIVDVMPHPGTSPQVVEVVEQFARSIGQIPVVLKKESFGYVFNFMLMNLFNSALNLAANGVASIEDIDRSWMGVMHTPVGPFGLMDQVGLKTVWTITEYWANERKSPEEKKYADFVKTYLDKGHMGAMSGEGFYRYPGPAFSRPGFVEGEEG